jgi:hypothetical protein
MKRLHPLLLAALIAASVVEQGAQAQSTTDTQNVRGDARAIDQARFEAGMPSTSHLSVQPDLVEMPAGHATLIPEAGTTGLLLATGALCASAWWRRRAR